MLLNSIQVIGSICIFYLANKFFTASKQDKKGHISSLGFRDGLVIQLFNVKGWMLVILMFSLFTRPAENLTDSAPIFLLCGLLFVLNVTCHFIWIVFGDLLERFLKTGQNEKIQNIVFGIMLSCVAAGLLIGVVVG